MRCDIESLTIRVRERILASFAAIVCGSFGATAGMANKELTAIAGFVWTIIAGVYNMFWLVIWGCIDTIFQEELRAKPENKTPSAIIVLFDTPGLAMSFIAFCVCITSAKSNPTNALESAGLASSILDGVLIGIAGIRLLMDASACCCARKKARILPVWWTRAQRANVQGLLYHEE